MSDYSSYRLEAGDGQGSQPGQPDAQVVGGASADRGEISVEGVAEAVAAFGDGEPLRADGGTQSSLDEWGERNER